MTEGSFVYDPKKRCYVRAAPSGPVAVSKFTLWRGYAISAAKAALLIGVVLFAVWLLFGYVTAQIGTANPNLNDAPQLNLTR